MKREIFYADHVDREFQRMVVSKEDEAQDQYDQLLIDNTLRVLPGHILKVKNRLFKRVRKLAKERNGTIVIDEHDTPELSKIDRIISTDILSRDQLQDIELIAKATQKSMEEPSAKPSLLVQGYALYRHVMSENDKLPDTRTYDLHVLARQTASYPNLGASVYQWFDAGVQGAQDVCELGFDLIEEALAYGTAAEYDRHEDYAQSCRMIMFGAGVGLAYLESRALLTDCTETALMAAD